MRTLFALLLIGCAQPSSPPPTAPPPPTPDPTPYANPTPPPASAPASASASAFAPPDAGVSPAEAALVSALKKDHASVTACHRAAKNARGKMTLRVVIGVNGKIEATSIAENPTVPMSLAQCVEARVRALRVEVSPTTVELPFHFGANAYDGPIVHYGNGPFDPGY